jgi:N-acetylglucosaminyldiphosphoundecaprenol N-acetyl-beta-D-mannosaminyltransferase
VAITLALGEYPHWQVRVLHLRSPRSVTTSAEHFSISTLALTIASRGETAVACDKEFLSRCRRRCTVRKRVHMTGAAGLPAAEPRRGKSNHVQSSRSTPADVLRHDRVDVLGVGVSAINLDDAVATIEHWISENSRNYVCVTGAHGVMESRRDQRLRRIHNEAGLVTPDGMPLVWFSRLSGKSRTERVCGSDLMQKMTAVSQLRGYRQFYYGGAEGVADKLKHVLIASHPGLEVVGTLCPPFRELTPKEDQAVVEAINEARPHILWLGLSTPKQEFWMASHLGRVEVPVMIGVGAAFDFLAGTRHRAPLWMQRNGLEWLFRLGSEPRRLWRRYAYIVPGFAVVAAGELLSRAIRSPEDASLGSPSRR